MGKLSKAPTEKDIDELIAEAEKEMDAAMGPIQLSYHTGGLKYLETLKTRLDLANDSAPTGKKLLKSNLKEEVEKQLRALDEAVGAEEPTDFIKGEMKALLWVVERFKTGTTDKDWKASAQRGEAA